MIQFLSLPSFLCHPTTLPHQRRTKESKKGDDLHTYTLPTNTFASVYFQKSKETLKAQIDSQAEKEKEPYRCRNPSKICKKARRRLTSKEKVCVHSFVIHRVKIRHPNYAISPFFAREKNTQVKVKLMSSQANILFPKGLLKLKESKSFRFCLLTKLDRGLVSYR